MQIAVIQHVLRNDEQEDREALANAAANATDMGAQAVVFPRVPVLADLSDGDPVDKVLAAIGEKRVDTVAYINTAAVPEGPHFATLPVLGSTALFVGDAVIDYQELLTMNKCKPGIAILALGAENDMQAEAVEELAIGLSTSLAGLVVVCEAVGAEPGQPGHGGSTIVSLGEVVAEAFGGDDETLTFEVDVPVPQPNPRALLPQIPTILSQRLAHHLGQKPQVDYPADLS